MTTDIKVLHVYTAISEVSKGIGFIGKDKKNTVQNYNFRGIDDIYNNINAELHKQRLIIVPNVLSHACVEYVGAKGNKQFHIILEVEYSFISCVDGSIVKGIAYGEALDSSDKATNKAMSQAYKYMMIQTFAIPVKDMEDADASSPDIGERVTQKNQYNEIPHNEVVDFISEAQVRELERLIKDSNTEISRFLKFAKASKLEEIAKSNFENLRAMLNKKKGG